MHTPEAIDKLIQELSRLPGIGPKTASRLSFYLLRNPSEQALALSEAIAGLHRNVVMCARCFNIAESDPCRLCADSNRDHSMICVVEEPLDVVAIERTGDYIGDYHVLHGRIAPTEGINPDDLKIPQLVSRVQGNSTIREVILATNPNLEGEATAMYIARQLDSTSVKVTRLARGLPIGGDLEYADQITLSRALSGRSLV